MEKANPTDTIAAISTAVGESGIGIVRMSGKDVLAIADKVFLSKDGRKPSEFKTFTTHYGWVVEDTRTKKVIDEALLTVMRAPKSYTKEDIVEINCHGGIVALRRVLDVVLENGCHLAQPGEFTKRAFLNGRIDLAQAEAIADIIKAKTDSALRIGVEQLKGTLSRQLRTVRDILLDILSVLEASIDFPDDEIGPANIKHILEELQKIHVRLTGLLKSSSYGRIFREGVNIVICGRPNVGKSSLLNALLKQERSIVTPVPGTTRDTVEEAIDIKGIPVKIIDTAGIIEPRDLVEHKAIQRSKRYIKSADIVLLLFDGSQMLAKEDRMLMRRLRRKVVLSVINKIDLKQKIDNHEIVTRFTHAVEISAKKNRNINLLEDAIANLVYNGKVPSQESPLVSNRRHIEQMREAQKLIAEAINSLDNNTALSAEFIAQNIKDALAHLDAILGMRYTEDLLDRIFTTFCIGK